MFFLVSNSESPDNNMENDNPDLSDNKKNDEQNNDNSNDENESEKSNDKDGASDVESPAVDDNNNEDSDENDNENDNNNENDDEDGNENEEENSNGGNDDNGDDIENYNNLVIDLHKKFKFPDFIDNDPEFFDKNGEYIYDKDFYRKTSDNGMTRLEPKDEDEVYYKRPILEVVPAFGRLRLMLPKQHRVKGNVYYVYTSYYIYFNRHNHPKPSHVDRAYITVIKGVNNELQKATVWWYDNWKAQLSRGITGITKALLEVWIEKLDTAIAKKKKKFIEVPKPKSSTSSRGRGRRKSRVSRDARSTGGSVTRRTSTISRDKSSKKRNSKSKKSKSKRKSRSEDSVGDILSSSKPRNSKSKGKHKLSSKLRNTVIDISSGDSESDKNKSKSRKKSDLRVEALSRTSRKSRVKRGMFLYYVFYFVIFFILF